MGLSPASPTDVVLAEKHDGAKRKAEAIKALADEVIQKVEGCADSGYLADLGTALVDAELSMKFASETLEQ